jgi:hypothetical protein
MLPMIQTELNGAQKKLHLHYIWTPSLSTQSLQLSQLQTFISCLSNKLPAKHIVLESVAFSQTLFAMLHQLVESQVFFQKFFDQKILIYNQQPGIVLSNGTNQEWLVSWRQILQKAILALSWSNNAEIAQQQATTISPVFIDTESLPIQSSTIHTTVSSPLPLAASRATKSEGKVDSVVIENASDNN